MEKAQTQFIALLQYSLWESPLDESLFANADWGSIIAIARQQTCDGIAFTAAAQLEGMAAPPRGAMLQWAGRTMQIEQINARHISSLRKLSEMYERHHICLVLLKGLGVAANYPDPSKRQSGDIDLFAYGENAFDNVLKMLRAEGICTTGKTTEKHLDTYFDGVHLEIHHTACHAINPLRDSTWDSLIADSARQAPCMVCIEKGLSVRTLPPTLNAIFLLNHMAEHLADTGLGLRQVSDWMLFLSHNIHQIDQTSLRSRLKSLGLTYEWKLFVTMCADYLGLPLSAAPLYDARLKRRANRLLDFIFRCGNFGKNIPIKHSSSFFGKKLNGLSHNLSHAIALLRIAPSLTITNFFFNYLRNAFKRIKNG